MVWFYGDEFDFDYAISKSVEKAKEADKLISSSPELISESVILIDGWE